MGSFSQKLNLQWFYNLSVGTIPFLICVLPKMVALGFILVFIVCLTGLITRQMKFKPNIVLYAFAAFYLAYAVGALFTNNPHTASKYLEYKLSFLIIPILFSFRPAFSPSISSSVFGLIAGIIVTSAFGWSRAFTCYARDETLLNCFTSGNISLDHPTYFTAFILISVASVWYLYKKHTPFFSAKWVFPYLAYGIMMMLLCYAMAGILFLLLLIVFIIFRWIYLRKSKWLAWILLIISPFALVLTVTSVPAFKNEIDNSMHALNGYIENPVAYVQGKEGVPSGDKVRLIMWTASTQELIDHPLGVGTGNVDDHLSERLASYGQTELAAKDENKSIKYNPHNQFLQTGLEIGIFGLIIFCFLLYQAIKTGAKYKNWLLVLIAVNLIFNCVFESMLQRQSGIIFYTFWICMLSAYSFFSADAFKNSTLTEKTQ